MHLFVIALGFFTRIPLPGTTEFSQGRLNQASRYFPLVGWLIGLLCAAIYYLADLYFSKPVAVLLSMAAGVLLTGAFHEDGLADTADGLGGGWTKQQKLAIMKDSRVGTFGAIALWFALALKFYLLLDLSNTALALLIAHPLSRTLATSFIYIMPYVRDSDSSKIKPLAESHQPSDFLISMGTGLLVFILIWPIALSVLAVLIVTGLILRRYLLKQIGGFSGDTLGATQQISELMIYLTMAASSPLL